MPKPLFDSLLTTFHERDPHQGKALAAKLLEQGNALAACIKRALCVAGRALGCAAMHCQQMTMRARPFLVGALLVAAASPVLYQAVSARAATREDAAIAAARSASADWPARFRDQPLTQLPFTALENLMSADFPGAVARFTDGHFIIVMREVAAPTRRLLPAELSLKALHYQIGSAVITSDAQGIPWSCFNAQAGNDKLHVCERFYDNAGASWTSEHAWFWATQYGGGPWNAVTLIEPLRSGS